MFGPFASVEDLPSRYKFVHVVARRARKLQSGMPPLVTPNSRKFTRIAQQEAMAGLLEVTTLKPTEAEASGKG